MKTAGFHHITMVSGDAARTVRFYRDVLGLRLVKRTVNFDDPGSYHLYFGDATGSPGTLLTFFEWPRSPRGRTGVGGIHHLALGVEGPEAQLRWKRRLMDRGVPVSGPYDRGWFYSIYFTDPDGQILEIATRGPGYATDEAPDALGERVTLPNAAQLPGGRDETRIRAVAWPDAVDTITADMKLDGIHHVSGITDDVELFGDFLEAALGLRLVKRSVNQDDPNMRHWFWARYDGAHVEPRSTLTMFEYRPAISAGARTVPASARAGVGQTHHIAFRARDETQQIEWRERLLSMDIEVSPVLDRMYFRSIYFRAPDGLLLEIATEGPGFMIDEPEAELGGSLQLPAWLEPERETIQGALVPLP